MTLKTAAHSLGEFTFLLLNTQHRYSNKSVESQVFVLSYICYSPYYSEQIHIDISKNHSRPAALC